MKILFKSAQRSFGCETDKGATESCGSCETSASGVPHSMLLNDSLRKNAKTLRTVPLIPLNCTFGIINEKPPLAFKSALRKEAAMTPSQRGAGVSVVFLVRRPGCVACREHGQQLTELAMEDPSVTFWAIVKETGVEEQGLLTFFSDYFHYPIYKDEKWQTFKAMGDRKLTPLKLLKRFFAAQGRWAKKGIPNRLKGGDIWVQGGILVFKKGKLRYCYEEDYGKELVISDIRAAIRSLQDEVDHDATNSLIVDGSSMFQSIRTEI